MALTVLRVVLEASWKLFWVALTVFGVVLEATWKPFWKLSSAS